MRATLVFLSLIIFISSNLSAKSLVWGTAYDLWQIDLMTGEKKMLDPELSGANDCFPAITSPHWAHSWGVTVNPITSDIYWADSRGVFRRSHESTVKEVIHTAEDIGLEAICTLDIDPITNDLFWIMIHHDAGVRAMLRFDPLESVFTDLNYTNLYPLKLRVDGDYLYWSTGTHYAGVSSGSIQRSSLTGENIVTLLDRPTLVRGLAIDSKGGHIYWGEKGSIYRASLSGKNVTKIYEGKGKGPLGITLDKTDRKIYWGTLHQEIDVLMSANLDGSNVSIITETSRVSAIALVP